MSTEQKERKRMFATHIRNLELKVRRFAIRLQYFAAFVLITACPMRILAQNNQAHAAMTQPQEFTADQQSKQSALIKIVRDSTERFRDVTEAEREGYALQFGCVSGPDQGAMGLHYVNGDLVGKGLVDATRPQIVIYEPTPDGHLRLIGADFLVLAATWDGDKTHTGPPQLMGQLFHYWESPNRFGLPAFYTLHVWAWKDNPNGAFVNWHPNVSCKLFGGQS
jgi:hypothetical protein